jgi:hypothetical protein
MVIVIPIVFLVAWPISIIGTSIGRNRGGMLQTPTRIYQHSSSGRTVFLVGVIHIGRKAYYEAIQSLIDQLSQHKFRILYEGVGKMDDKDMLALPPKQRVIAKQMRAISSAMQEMSALLLDEGIVYQKQGLSYPDSWIRTDVDISHMVQLFAEADLHFWEGPSDKPEKKVLDDVPEDVVGFIKALFVTAIRLLPGISKVMGVFTQFNPKKRARQHIIITLRNEVAARGILEHAEHSDVLSIWGAGHIPGIHEHLSTAGYRHTQTIWFDAF